MAKQRVNMTIDQNVYQAVEELRELQGRSLSNMINYLLATHPLVKERMK
ncbi:MAG: hypothetical protein PHT33_06860 [bacterium]|nr:hypothetical protein [bacterium]